MTSPLEMYIKFVLTKSFLFGQNPEIGQKMANGRLLFQALTTGSQYSHLPID